MSSKRGSSLRTSSSIEPARLHAVIGEEGGDDVSQRQHGYFAGLRLPVEANAKIRDAGGPKGCLRRAINETALQGRFAAGITLGTRADDCRVAILLFSQRHQRSLA